MALNALNAVGSINDAITLANNNKAKPELFYDKQLLDTIRMDAEAYKHYRLATTTPIQNKADRLQIRRWSPLQAHTAPLAEGVPPTSDKGSVESYEIPTFAYGRFMEFSDRVDFEIIDPVVAHYTKEYTLVAMETLDLIARDTLYSVAQVFYANAKTAFKNLTIGDKPSLNDFRLIVLTMKKQLVKPRLGSRFQVLGTPEFFFDMISDPLVEKYMGFNNTTKNMYDDGMLVPMFDMEFYEVQNAKMGGEFIDADGKLYLRVYRYNTNTSAYQYANLVEDTYLTTADGFVKDSRTGKDASYIVANKVWDIDGYNDTIVDGFGDYEELKVHPILVLGADCLTRTEISGEGNAKMYTKAKGSTGVLDPIDQRQSIGFKINSVGFGSTRTEAVAVYFCVPEHANLF